MSGKPTRRAVLAGFGAVTASGLLLRSELAWALPAVPPDEDGYDMWLRYRQVTDRRLLESYRRAFTHVVAVGQGPVVASAAAELVRGLSGLLGRPVEQEPAPRGDGAVIVGTPESAEEIAQSIAQSDLADVGPEGYLIRRIRWHGRDMVVVASPGERGALYGAFALLRHLQTYRAVDVLEATERPMLGLRLVNHWDNMDRTVERGYAGLSVFHWDELPEVLPHYADYARTLASVGVNGTVINNVNANVEFLSDEFVATLPGLAEVFRAWGITLYLSANFASPMILDGLPTADPFDAGVKTWWQNKATTIYDTIPDFGGFLVKANSEGQPGPGDYGRTHADGANMLAEAVGPHGGIIMWRAFIHDFIASTWASKSYKTFQPLDGQFADNVVLQIKNGPIDFQVREPVHPLFGALPNTNSMMELQITQEYTGQTTHVCYVVPEWKQVYAHDTHAAGTGPTVAEVVNGTAFGYSRSGTAGVMNFGDDRDWTRHQLAAANTHGYARLAWNPDLPAEEVADEWVRMTYGNDPDVVATVTGLLLGSWETYEAYSSPLGCGFMTWGGDHFDPLPVLARQFHGANETGVGLDRTMATGLGDTGLYFPPLRDAYESLDQCPEELLLFFHHVPYTHRLRSGSTVVQHIYDTHFDGRDAVLAMRKQWAALTGKVDAERHADTSERFDRHVEHATVWRDTLAAYFFERSKIFDERREWVQVSSAEPPVLLAGIPSRVEVTVGNASRHRVDVTAKVAAPDGWDTGTGRIILDPAKFGDVTVRATPAGATVDFVTLHAGADTDVDVLTGTAAKINANVAPPGQLCSLALDAGTTVTPLQVTYQLLTPTDVWSAERGYGWVGGQPQVRDRGANYDPLLRDFCNDTRPRVLRIAVPPGSHDTYVLVGDSLALYPTYIRSGGQLLAQSERMDRGGVWLHFTLDGGDAGREVDLELSSDPGQHWHLNALALIDETATLPAAVLSKTTVSTRDSATTITAHVANTTDAPLSVTVTAAVPDGWSAPEVRADVPARDVATVDLPLTPTAPTTAPATADVTLRLTSAADDRTDTVAMTVDIPPTAG
jgi:alpha-glucuronidase